MRIRTPPPPASGEAAASPLPGDTLLIASRFTIQICQTQIGRPVPRAYILNSPRVRARARYDTLRVTVSARSSQSMDPPGKKNGLMKARYIYVDIVTNIVPLDITPRARRKRKHATKPIGKPFDIKSLHRFHINRNGCGFSLRGESMSSMIPFTQLLSSDDLRVFLFISLFLSLYNVKSISPCMRNTCGLYVHTCDLRRCFLR